MRSEVLIEIRHTDSEYDWDSQCQMYRHHDDFTEGVAIDFGEIDLPSPAATKIVPPAVVNAPSSDNIDPIRARLIGEERDDCLQAVMELMTQHTTQAAEIIIRAIPDSPNQGSLATAIGMLGAGLVVEPLITALTDEDERLRSMAAMMLGVFRDARAVEPLSAALQDENEEVRTKALKALNSIASLENEDPVGRQAAIEVLETIA